MQGVWDWEWARLISEDTLGAVVLISYNHYNSPTLGALEHVIITVIHPVLICYNHYNHYNFTTFHSQLLSGHVIPTDFHSRTIIFQRAQQGSTGNHRKSLKTNLQGLAVVVSTKQLGWLVEMSFIYGFFGENQKKTVIQKLIFWISKIHRLSVVRWNAEILIYI